MSPIRAEFRNAHEPIVVKLTAVYVKPTTSPMHALDKIWAIIHLQRQTEQGPDRGLLIRRPGGGSECLQLSEAFRPRILRVAVGSRCDQPLDAVLRWRLDPRTFRFL